jgi:hypothetical protein
MRGPGVGQDAAHLLAARLESAGCPESRHVSRAIETASLITTWPSNAER